MWEDPYTRPRSPLEALGKYLTGSRTYDYDLSRFIKHRQREADKEISAAGTALNFAQSKGDFAGARYYAKILQEKMMDKARKLGMIEGS